MLQDTINEHKQTIKPKLTRDFMDAFLFEIENHSENKNDTFTGNLIISHVSL